MEKYIISDRALAFISLIKTGELPKQLLPNSAPNYTSSQEQTDTDYYSEVFLNSSCYDFIKQSEVVQYNGE